MVTIVKSEFLINVDYGTNNLFVPMQPNHWQLLVLSTYDGIPQRYLQVVL